MAGLAGVIAVDIWGMGLEWLRVPRRGTRLDPRRNLRWLRLITTCLPEVMAAGLRGTPCMVQILAFLRCGMIEKTLIMEIKRRRGSRKLTIEYGTKNLPYKFNFLFRLIVMSKCFWEAFAYLGKLLKY